MTHWQRNAPTQVYSGQQSPESIREKARLTKAGGYGTSSNNGFLGEANNTQEETRMNISTNRNG